MPSSLKKRVIPLRWDAINATFAQGTASTIDLSTFLQNPQNRQPVTYGHTGSLPAGVTRTGSVLSYDGVGAAGTTTANFTATWGSLTATSSATIVAVSTVQVGNRPPVWNVADGYLLAGPYTDGTAATYNLAQHASDPDGDPLAYGRAGTPEDTAPAAITVSAAGVLTIPATTPPGPYQIVAEVV